MDIGLDGLPGIILTGGNLFQCCRMDHVIHAVQGAPEPCLIPHIPDEKAELIVRVQSLELILHLELLELIPGIDDQLLRIVLR